MNVRMFHVKHCNVLGALSRPENLLKIYLGGLPMNYEYEMVLYYYDIMAGCETGGCSDFHLDYCWQNGICFYSNMVRACYTALEIGWY